MLVPIVCRNKVIAGMNFKNYRLMCLLQIFIPLCNYKGKKLLLPNYLLQIYFGTLRTAFIIILSLTIQELSLTLQQFQRSQCSERTYLTKGVIEIIFVVKFSQNFIRHEDNNNSTTPFDIYLPYIHKALRYYQNWCGLLLFYPCQGNARSHTTDKANIVPTPYFLSAFVWELGSIQELS